MMRTALDPSPEDTPGILRYRSICETRRESGLTWRERPDARTSARKSVLPEAEVGAAVLSARVVMFY